MFQDVRGLNNFGANVLYRNNGDGTFTDVTGPAGVGNGHQVGAGACFLDMEGDGDLDLYVSNYVKFTYETHVPKQRGGFPIYPGPIHYPPSPDTLYPVWMRAGVLLGSLLSGVSGYLALRFLKITQS